MVLESGVSAIQKTELRISKLHLFVPPVEVCYVLEIGQRVFHIIKKAAMERTVLERVMSKGCSNGGSLCSSRHSGCTLKHKLEGQFLNSPDGTVYWHKLQFLANINAAGRAALHRSRITQYL